MQNAKWNPSNWPTWLLIITPGLLFLLAWVPISITPLLWIAFVPLIILVQRFQHAKRLKYYGVLYLALFFWNLLTTWWVYFASPSGAVSMLILNSLFMLLPFISFRYNIKWNWANRGLLFIGFWMLYEFGHHRWDLSWPWLALGNGYSGMPSMVQWYEYTGIQGGTLLTLILNFLLFAFFQSSSKRYLLWSFSVVGLVFILSFSLRYRTNINEGKPLKVAVLQPSFDPWNEKFVRSSKELNNEMVNISLSCIDSTTDWLLWPETALAQSLNISDLSHTQRLSFIDRLLNSNTPKLKLVTGMTGVEYYHSRIKPNRSARKTAYDDNLWYNIYNSALFVDTNLSLDYYHKSKLVPGTEQMPFIQTFPFLEKLALSLDENSITGSLGVMDSAKALGSSNQIAPIICYESIYGDYVNEFVKDGAQWLGVITNDAWWNNTPGYKQHFSYSILRCIEQRKWLARSANTGISGFIDPLGNTYQNTDWYQKTCVQQTIYANKNRTLYSKLGDSLILIISLVTLCLVSIIKGFLT
jgi:apolipoprotein N-acyltransferase